MNKRVFTILLLSFLSNFAHARYVFSEYWDGGYNPKVNMTCTNEDATCLKTCGQKKTCEFSATVCRDCISTSMLMTNIFENMTLFYRNSGVEININELTRLLSSGRFVAISSRSIYNQNDSFDSDELRIKFQDLCPSWIKYPVVFFSLKAGTNILQEAKYVSCDSMIFKMTTDKELVESMNQNLLH